MISLRTRPYRHTTDAQWPDRHRSAEVTIVVVGASTLGLLVEGLVHANMLSLAAMVGDRHSGARQRVVRTASWDEAVTVTGQLDRCVVIAGARSRPEGPQLRDAAATPVVILDAQTVLENACGGGGWRTVKQRRGHQGRNSLTWLQAIRMVLTSWRR